MTKEFVELINIVTAQRRKVNAENKERIEQLIAVGFKRVVKIEKSTKPKKVSKKDDDVLSG